MHTASNVVQIARVWAYDLLDEGEAPVLIEWELDAGVWPPARPVLKSGEHRVGMNKSTPRVGDDDGPAAAGRGGGNAAVRRELREPVPLIAFDPDLGGGRRRTRRRKSTGHDV